MENENNTATTIDMLMIYYASNIIYLVTKFKIIMSIYIINTDTSNSSSKLL